MVLRTFANFSIASRSSYNFKRRASNASAAAVRTTTASINKGSDYSHPFFNPSYVKPNEVVAVDEVANKDDHRNKTRYGPIFMPVLTVTRNYLIFDSSKGKNQDQEAKENKRILLKKATHKVNKNGHVSISVESISNSHTTLNIRRSNSNYVKTLVLNNNSVIRSSQQRTYATTAESPSALKEVEEQLSNLNVEDKESSPVITLVGEIGDSKVVPEIEQLAQVESHLIDEALLASEEETKITNDPIQVQEDILDQLINHNKPNEMLAVYLRMRGNELVPTVSIYNKVLKSISQRYNTDETTEEKLTHLLNVYSDMLSNNLKPTDQTYELVINPLLSGSLKSYRLGKFKDGLDFFKIALELFLISHNANTKIKFEKEETYLNLLQCLNDYQMVTGITPVHLHKILKDKIDKNKIDFYLGLINFAKYSKDEQYIELLYDELKAETLPEAQASKQFEIYSTLIESLNYCGSTTKSSQFLDLIVNSIEDKSLNSKPISGLLSSYIQSQALTNPYDAYQTYIKFDNIDWLPDVSVKSLLTIFKVLLNLNDSKKAKQIWNTIIIRQDFDESVQTLSDFENYHFLDSFLDQYVDLLLLEQNNSNLIKITREIILKKSLVLSNEQLIKLVAFLNTIESSSNLSMSLIINQGEKKSFKDELSFNNYLSMIIDYIQPEVQYPRLFDTLFFKKTIEEYRLCRDNIYGLIKMFNYFRLTQDKADSDNKTFQDKLSYYTNVLLFEFNDAANHYVQLPDELIEFKSQLQTLSDGDSESKAEVASN